MKNKKIIFTTIILIFIAVILISVMPSQFAYAVTYTPYTTSTIGPDGETVNIQNAYEPETTISSSSKSEIGSLSNPEDMAYDEDTGYIYVADTGNKRVVVFDGDGEVVSVVGEGVFSSPMGVTTDGSYLYVCDKTNQLVYMYDKTDYSLVNEIGRPDNPLVGSDTPYVPVKVAADGRDSIYLVSEGCVSGLMQISTDGEFLGYVGMNETTSTFKSVLQNLFYSSEQKSIFLASPRSPTNVTIDDRGLVYTVTNSASSNAVKKLNTLGNVILTPSVNYSDAVAVAVDSSENIFVVESTGYIDIFDSYGDVLFSFGGSSSDERLGSLSNPVAIDVTEDGDILVLDKNYSMVVVYARTEFSELVYTAVDYYKDGLYLEGEPYWEQVLQYNSNFIIAYKALARANMKRGDYETALTQFKLAEDKDGYSDAYWEIRNEWLQDNLMWIFVLIIVIVALIALLKFIDRLKPKLFAKPKQFFGRAKKNKATKGLLYTVRFTKAPQDAVYEVKYHGATSVPIAVILYVWFVVLQILSVVLKGYLFNSTSVYSTNGWQLVLTYTGILLMFVVCNYLVSTVSDGEGKFKHVFISVIYGLSPYLLMALPVFIISNFLTYNENIVYVICEVIMYGLSALCLFRSIMELHDYNIRETIKNVLLTIFTFAMVILFAVVIRMLCAQFFGYFTSIFKELINNVF